MGYSYQKQKKVVLRGLKHTIRSFWFTKQELLFAKELVLINGIYLYKVEGLETRRYLFGKISWRVKLENVIKAKEI